MLKPLNRKDFIFNIVEDLGMIYVTKESKERKRYGRFKCGYCGNVNKMPVASAKKAIMCNTCSNRKAATTHGMSNTSLYLIWKNMKQRCLNANHPQAKDYSIRGITLCTDWQKSYIVFEKWAMNNGFNTALTLDRKNNDMGYTPSNCRFVSRLIQSQNKRKIISTNTSGFRGVGKNSSSNTFYARISVNNKKIHIGSFITKELAASAYDAYIDKHKLEHTKNG